MKTAVPRNREKLDKLHLLCYTKNNSEDVLQSWIAGILKGAVAVSPVPYILPMEGDAPLYWGPSAMARNKIISMINYIIA